MLLLLLRSLLLTFFCFFPLKTITTAQRSKDDLKIVCSAAIIENDYEKRKEEYIKGLSLVKHYGYEPYVIEACKKCGPTFLDDYVLSDRIFYSSVHNSALKNKGVNEAMTMLEGLNYFAFNDDDMIIKVTARYYLVSDYFIKLVENNPTYDVFVLIAENGYAITGCFAMRYKYFKNMLETLDLTSLEKEFRCLEADVANYIRKIENKRNARVMKVKKLDLLARWALDGRIVRY